VAENIEKEVRSTSKNTSVLDRYKLITHQLDSLRKLDNYEVDNEVYVLTIKSEIEHKLGQLSESEKSAVEALKLLDLKNPSAWRTLSKIKILNQLGRIKIEVKDFEKAISYFERAFNLSNDDLDKCQILNNLAVAFYQIKEYKLAIKNYEQSLKLSSLLNNKNLQARIMSNLGLCQSKINDKKALKNLNKALKIRDSLQFMQGIITSHLHLSEYYNDRNNSKIGLFHANKALDIATKSKLIPLEKSALENVLSLANNDLVRRYAFLNDSINTVNQNTSNKFAEARYNLSLKDKEAQQVKAKNDYYMSLKEKEAAQLKTKNSYQLFIFGMATVLLLLLATFLYSRINQKNKIALIKESIATENRISVRIHDELANDVYNTMIKVQNKNIKDPDLMNDIDHIYKRVRNISIENSPIDEDIEFDSQLNDLFLSYKNNGVNIITRHITPVNWSRLKSHEKTAVYRSFQELLINMKKHSQATHVLISFQKNGSKIKGVFKDNGVGCDFIKGNGLSNVETRMKTINGSITFDSQKDNGFTATIII
jgi:signal transduction histidine kinase